MKSIWKLSVTVAALIPTDSPTTSRQPRRPVRASTMLSFSSTVTPCRVGLQQAYKSKVCHCLWNWEKVWGCFHSYSSCHSSLIWPGEADVTTNRCRPVSALSIKSYWYICFSSAASNMDRSRCRGAVESVRVNVQSRSRKSEPHAWQKQSLFINVWQFKVILYRSGRGVS